MQLQLPSSFAACAKITEATGGACEVPVNARVHARFVAAVAHIDRAGLGQYVVQFQTVNRRRCRDARTAQFLPHCISNHSYGLAADVRPFADNAHWNTVVRNEPGVQQMIDIFRAHGFRWGNTFANNPDPQHVEWTPS